jgi:hypothetical protein
VLASGWLEYIAGLICNSAAMVYKSEMKELNPVTSSLIYFSIFFQGLTSGMQLGAGLFILSVLGALRAAFKSPELRLLAITLLLTQLLIVAGSLAVVTFIPTLTATLSIIYFEKMLFPFYAIFTAYLVISFLDLNPSHAAKGKLFDIFLPLIFVSIVTITLLNIPRVKESAGSFLIKPSSTAITDILEKEIAVQQHRKFSGRVASIIIGKNWLDQLQYFASINNLVGNDHQSTGLWLKHIPTLHEYNQAITPGFYRIYRRFLTDGSDIPHRSWSSFNKVDIKILKLLGVSFIISDESEIHEAKQRAKVNFNGKIPALYLHEISGSNLTGISVLHIKKVNNIRQAEDFMATSQFELQDAVVINKKDGESDDLLVQAKDSKFSIEGGKYSLKANSKGKTLLILPIEYSHCLAMAARTGKMPKIIRVDIALAGLLFENFVDVTIDNKIGPFSQPRCRFKDYREFASMIK